MNRMPGNRPLVLVFHTASRTYWSDIVQGISSFARSADWNLQVVENEVASRTVFRDLVRFWKPSGCIFEDSIGSCENDDLRAVKGIPTVFVNCERTKQSSSLTSITVNSRGIGELAVKELFSAGLESFAYYGFSDFQWSDERLEGYRTALRLNGRDCVEFTRSFKEPDRAYRKRLINWVGTLPRPCGIFAANDLLATELLNACSVADIRVPEDVCVLGVDNDEESCESARPTLSSINPDFVGEGVLAANTLAQLMQGETKIGSRQLFGTPMIVRRQSTRRLRSHMPDTAAALEFIRLNASRGISARDVFPLFACTRRRAEQRFRAEVGHSVLDEINAVRIEKAKELLQKPSRAIESIAGECGFSSSAHLRVLFRRLTGQSLRDWRTSHFNGSGSEVSSRSGSSVSFIDGTLKRAPKRG